MKYIFFLILVLYTSNLIAQDNYIYGINYDNQLLLLDDNSINDKAHSFEIHFHNQTHKKLWQYRYNWPMIGFNLLYTDFYRQEFGKTLMFGPSIIWKTHSKFGIEQMVFPGLAIFNNIQNTQTYGYISLPINFSFRTRTNLYYNLNKNYTFTLGYTYTHFSNGNLDYPNKGLNMVATSFGLRKRFNGYRLKENKWLNEREFGYQRFKLKYKDELMIFTGIGSSYDVTRYAVYSVGYYIRLISHPLYEPFFGITWDYYDKHGNFFDSQKYNLSIGCSMLFSNKFSFIAQTNLNFYDSDYNYLNEKIETYFKNGIRFKIGPMVRINNSKIGLTVNTHLFSSQYSGIEYRYIF